MDRVAEWSGRTHRLPRAAVCAGLRVRVPSPLGRVVLPIAGLSVTVVVITDVELYIPVTANKRGYGPKVAAAPTRTKFPTFTIIYNSGHGQSMTFVLMQYIVRHTSALV